METPCVATAPLPDCWVVGNGLLGGALAGALQECGTRVLVLDPSAPADVVGDAADVSVLRCASALLPPQLVFCCQATGGGSEADYQRTYAGVVGALKDVVPQARMVFCSSTSVYGSAVGEADEDTQPVCPSVRAQVLLSAESVVLERGGIVLRLAPLYGGKRCEVLRRFLCGAPCLPGKAERLLNYLHVDDAVRALHTAATAASGCYNVSGECYCRGDLYALLAEVTGRPVPQHVSSVSRRGLSDRRINCDRLLRLGWRPMMNLRRFTELYSDRFLPDAT